MSFLACALPRTIAGRAPSMHNACRIVSAWDLACSMLGRYGLPIEDAYNRALLLQRQRPTKPLQSSAMHDLHEIMARAKRHVLHDAKKVDRAIFCALGQGAGDKPDWVARHHAARRALADAAGLPSCAPEDLAAWHRAVGAIRVCEALDRAAREGTRGQTSLSSRSARFSHPRTLR